MNATVNPFRCPGCHGGPWADFDHYCDVLEVPMAQSGHAFAAWMAGTGWRGEYGKLPARVEP